MLFALMTLVIAQAQEPSDGITYFLPKTSVRFSILVEKTTFTPGELAQYAEIYLRTQVTDKPSTTYRIVSSRPELSLIGIPDSTKEFNVMIDKKHSIINVSRDENGVITAINTQAPAQKPTTHFTPARQKAPLNPRNFMSQEILSAGSKAKMAQLVAQEIYDIRDSRNQLSRGEAETMPKDGEQLRIMMDNLDTQERALLQLFQGTTVVDTTETIVNFTPEKAGDKQLLFRFSKYFGMCDRDDLSGEPYYVNVIDLHVIQPLETSVDGDKKSKEDVGLNVSLPGKIRLTLTHKGKKWVSYDIFASQFGRVESLSGLLFGKKFTSRLVLNPTTGGVVKLETEPLE